MASSWDELETKLYDTLVAVKTATPPAEPLAVLGNVHRFEPEHEQSSKLPAYFLADVGARRPEVRAWCVFVTQALDHDTLNTTSIRLTARVRAWYEKGVGGVGVKRLQAHMSVYQGELKGCGRSLGGTVSLIRDWSPVSYRSAANPVESREGEVIVGEFTIEALRGMGKI